MSISSVLWAQVAELMLRGMEEGRYIVLFPDTVATCITSVLSGTAVPSLPLWIVAPLAPIVVKLVVCPAQCLHHAHAMLM